MRESAAAEGSEQKGREQKKAKGTKGDGGEGGGRGTFKETKDWLEIGHSTFSDSTSGRVMARLGQGEG